MSLSVVAWLFLRSREVNSIVGPKADRAVLFELVYQPVPCFSAVQAITYAKTCLACGICYAGNSAYAMAAAIGTERIVRCSQITTICQILIGIFGRQHTGNRGGKEQD